MGLSVHEFYSMTMGNFTRASMGYQKRKWEVQREVIAAIMRLGGAKIKGKDIFDFGNPVADMKELEPNEAERDLMRIRHEQIIKQRNGR